MQLRAAAAPVHIMEALGRGRGGEWKVALTGERNRRQVPEVPGARRLAAGQHRYGSVAAAAAAAERRTPRAGDVG